MSLDYKTYQTKSQPHTKARTWPWLFFGCLIGLSVSLFVTLDKSWKTWWQTVEFTPFWERTHSPTAKTPEDSKPESNQAAPEPQFDFYNVLPEMEVVVPEPTQQQPTQSVQAPATTDTTQPNNATTPQTTTVAAPEAKTLPGPVYILQVGAFKSQPEADRLKAQLALTGLHAGIETSTMPSGAIWYRVKLGPYRDENAIDKHKQLLQAQGIQTFKVKIER